MLPRATLPRLLSLLVLLSLPLLAAAPARADMMETAGWKVMKTQQGYAGLVDVPSVTERRPSPPATGPASRA